MTAAASPRTPTESDVLWRLLENAGERIQVKLDYADVLEEIARRADARSDFDRFRWFDAKAAAVRDCSKVRIVPHVGTDHGVATPISCHVRGEPDCERARVARLLERHDAAVLEAERPVFLTLTSRNAPRGGLEDARKRQAKHHDKLRRRALIRGGRCRHMWRFRDRTGELDGAPFHPCHPPLPALDCRPPSCAPGCPARGDRRAEHGPACTQGCPTRTGLRRSRCQEHRPAELHRNGCPRSCEHRGHRRDRNCPDFAHGKVAGGIASFDITFNETAADPWNLHLHMLLDAPAWIDWAELRDTWQAITCDRQGCPHGWDPACTGAWMVWIVKVDASDEDARHRAIREVLKYVAKPHGIVDSLDPSRVEEYLWATRHQRIAQGWGTWYAIRLEDDEPDVDHHVIRIGFSSYRVPKVCPICQVLTGEDDWGWPFERGRLEATRLARGYGWRHPPPVDLPTPAPAAGVIPTSAESQEGRFAW